MSETILARTHHQVPARFGRWKPILPSWAAAFAAVAASGCIVATKTESREAPRPGSDAAPRGDHAAPANAEPPERPDAKGVAPWRAAPEPLEAALAAVGLTSSQFRIDLADASFFGGGVHKQQLWEAFMHDPLRIEPDAKIFRKALLEGAGSAGQMVPFGALRLREGVRRGLIESPLVPALLESSEEAALATAVEALQSRGGRRPSSRERFELARSAAKVPASIARPAAFLLRSIAAALDWRDRALASLPPARREELFRDLAAATAKGGGVESEEAARTAYGLAAELDAAAMYAGAADLGLAVDAAIGGIPAGSQRSREGAFAERDLSLRGLRDRCREASPPSEESGAGAGSRHPDGGEAASGCTALQGAFVAKTPYGEIVISGDGDDRHSGPALLIIDTGGNDQYAAAAATRSGREGISIAIDLGGDDRWIAPGGDAPRPAFGCGILGYGYLIDLAGNDVYEAASLSMGAGAFGVGLLVDGAGNDRYRGTVFTQGASVFGLGILSDLGGTDDYHCTHQCQGLGLTRGFGALVDAAGADLYVADDTVLRFPSPQSPEHNTSLAQGCGAGRRADFSDGLSLAGGIGLLVDGGGDDVYRAGLFAQGAAYWYGVGILDDAGGDDRYEGIWYVQGSAAHFAIGALVDEGGNDVYRATMNMAQGAGHDFSWGELIDDAGDDAHDAPNLSLGGGNDNGIGFFWDRGGDDAYAVTAETTLGRANITSPRGGLRDGMLCAGLFLDTGGGSDSYTKPFARDRSLWTQSGINAAEPIEAEKGAGLDR